jgi:16S rRNA (cytosine967-C5)-methyltransferase
LTDRERALHLLRRIDRESLYATLLLHDETGFVRTLVLGVLRWRSRLDFVIRAFANRAVEEEILDVLRLGAYQLLYMDVAPYAAVSETVELAPQRARGFVNAILRQITRKGPPVPSDLATLTSHPAWLIDRWTRRFGEARAAEIAAANQELSYPDVLAYGDAPPGGTPSAFVDGIYTMRTSTADLDRNIFWPMDEGSAVIAAIAANAGSEVLDLAAAPGSKTTYMMWRGTRVTSNDVSIGRLLPLGRGGRIVVSDGRMPPFRRQFQTVLLDAPCSATGTIRKNPELKWRLRESDLAGFASLQRELLIAALELAAETCVYSTCSLEPEENEEVIASVAGRGFAIADISRYAPPGVAPWIRDGVLHLTPESGADGFTAFVLTRAGARL